jgi:UDP-galactopyranose mutase
MNKKNILIVGAGFSGAVCAREIAENSDYEIEVIDKRNHIAGNCFTSKNDETGIMEHIYGPHIFHTSNKKVWEYINKYGEFNNFVNRVKSSSSRGIYSMPINLHTINQFFSKKFNPTEAQEYVNKISDKSIKDPQNFEEQALKFIGKDLYFEFFYGYTKKQWGVEPSALPASILKRLPVRFNYNDNYYNSVYQGIPVGGYTQIIKNILNHKSINVSLNTSFCKDDIKNFDYVIYTGPIDAFFDFQFGKLGYRTVFWERQILNGDFQGNAVINYPETSTNYTRVHEHKHFTPENSFDKTIIYTEYSKETGFDDEPFYPKRLSSDMEIFEKYKLAALNLDLNKNVSFLGRLGTYRYMDMHNVIGEAMSFSSEFIKKINTKEGVSVFPI